jgi:hypothetical protein
VLLLLVSLALVLATLAACENSPGQPYKPGDGKSVIEVPASQLVDPTPGENQILVFVLDKKAYYPDGLHIAQPDACSYVHVHGPEIFAVVPDAHLYIANDKDYKGFSAKESEGECGYGEPDFRLIKDTDSDGKVLRKPS